MLNIIMLSGDWADTYLLCNKIARYFVSSYSLKLTLSYRLWPKRFMLLWRSHQLLSGFLSNCHLPHVSRQSHISNNYKGNNETKPRAVHRCPGIYLMAEENPEISYRRPSEIGMTSHCLKWCSLPTNDVGRK